MTTLTVDQRWHLGDRIRCTLTPIEQMWAKYGKIDRPCSGCVFLIRGKVETICRCGKFAHGNDNIFHGHSPACGAFFPRPEKVKMYQEELILED